MWLSKVLKEKIKKIRLKERFDSDTFISFLKKRGVNVGCGVRIFDPVNTVIDLQNPHMLKIGNNVRITKGVTILTHDYSWSVLAGKYGEILGGVGTVDIGNNVFIGMNATILKNTTIGDNVIIGAGSVVSGKLESDSVYAGVPCKRIMSLDEYYIKRKSKQQDEYKEIISRLDFDVNEEVKNKATREYFGVFINKGESLEEEYISLIERTGYGEKILQNWYKKTES